MNGNKMKWRKIKVVFEIAIKIGVIITAIALAIGIIYELNKYK